MTNYIAGSTAPYQDFSPESLKLSQGAIEPSFGVFDGMGDVFATSFMNNADLMLIEGMSDLQNLHPYSRPPKEMTPDEVFAKYGLKVKEPITDLKAKLVASIRDARGRAQIRASYLDDTIENAGAKHLAASLAVGMVGGALSPSSIALTVGTAGLNAFTGQAIEGVVENIAGRHIADKYGLEYTNLDAAIDLFAPLTLGTLVGGGAKFKNYMQGRLKKASTESLGNISNGKNTEIVTPKVYADTETLTVKSPGDTVKSFDSKDLGPVYTAKSSSGELAGFNTNYSNNGVVYVDSKEIALSEVAPSAETTQGKIYSKPIAASPIDGNIPVEDIPELKAALIDTLEDTQFEFELEDSDISLPVSEFMDNISQSAKLGNTPELLDMVEESFAKAGIDGFSFPLKTIDGNKLDTEAKGYHLFNGDELTPADSDLLQEAVSPEINTVKDAAINEQIAKEQSNQTSALPEPEMLDEVNSLKPFVDYDIEIESLLNTSKKELDELLEEFIDENQTVDTVKDKGAIGKIDEDAKQEQQLFDKILKDEKNHLYHGGSFIDLDISNFDPYRSDMGDVYYGAGMYFGNNPSPTTTYSHKYVKSGKMRRYKLKDSANLLQLKAKPNTKLGQEAKRIAEMYRDLMIDRVAEIRNINNPAKSKESYVNEMKEEVGVTVAEAQLSYQLDGELDIFRPAYSLWRIVNRDVIGDWRHLFTPTELKGVYKHVTDNLMMEGYDGLQVRQVDSGVAYIETALWGSGEEISKHLEEVPTLQEAAAATIVNKGLESLSTMVKAGIFCVRNN